MRAQSLPIVTNGLARRAGSLPKGDAITDVPPPAATRGFGNFLLDALPDESRAVLAPRLEHVALPIKMVLETAGEPVTHAYFVTAGVASRVALTADPRLEIGVIGREA